MAVTVHLHYKLETRIGMGENEHDGRSESIRNLTEIHDQRDIKVHYVGVRQ
jgi:hypothetical protein